MSNYSKQVFIWGGGDGGIRNLGSKKHQIPAVLRIRIRDPVPFLPMDPGSGIRNGFFPDPRSQTHMFESLVTIFGVKSSIIL
jgi:hypothetical protein